MNHADLLDKVKATLNIKSDYALAKILDIPSGKISDYRNGKRVPDNYAIAKFAKVLGIDPWTLLKKVEAQTEKNPERRDFWKKQAMWAGAVLTAVIFNMSPTPAQAAPTLQATDLTMYIMSNARQLKQRLLQALKIRIPESLLRFFVPRIYQATT